VLAPERIDPVPSDGIISSISSSTPIPPSIDVELRPTRVAGYAAIVTLRGEHDLNTGPELTAALDPIAGHVLLDLTACTFIDSTAVGIVIDKSQDLARNGHRLELVVPAANRTVARVVDVVGLRGLLTVHPELPLAVGASEPASTA
jgi:anti-sigma B factor antagonist